MKLWTILTMSVFLIFIACSKEEIPQDFLSGTIDNMSFNVGQSTYSQIGTTELEFNIFSDAFTSNDPCLNLPEGIRLFFKAENSLERQELFLDLNSFEAFTVSIFSDTQLSSNIITDGFFQITEIKDDIITGTLDIKSDGGTEVKGQFTSLLCE